jgi:hypothetical protein
MAENRVQCVSETRDASEFFDDINDAHDWLDTISKDDVAEEVKPEEIVGSKNTYLSNLHPPRLTISGTSFTLGIEKISLSNKWDNRKTETILIENGYEKTYEGKTGVTWELKDLK